jgi:hypothetical protein
VLCVVVVDLYGGNIELLAVAVVRWTEMKVGDRLRERPGQQR